MAFILIFIAAMVISIEVYYYYYYRYRIVKEEEREEHEIIFLTGLIYGIILSFIAILKIIY